MLRLQGSAMPKLSIHVVVLESTKSVKQLLGVVYTNLGTLLQSIVDFDGAQDAYEKSIALNEEVGNQEDAFNIRVNLGIIDIHCRRFESAKKNITESLNYFRSISLYSSEAYTLHNLGVLYEATNEWDKAEKYFRDSAAIKVRIGNINGTNGAIVSWLQLASVYHKSGKFETAEVWYRKCLSEFDRSSSYYVYQSTVLTLLGELLLQFPDRLSEAREVAEEALIYRLKIDPRRAGIWRVYDLLEAVAKRQNDMVSALKYAQASDKAKTDALKWLPATEWSEELN